MPDEKIRLDSWKQIAAFLGKSERTVRRWHEVEGLPVHKHPHQQRGSVWAYDAELAAWLERRQVSPPVAADGPERIPPRRRGWLAAGAVGIVLTLTASGWWFSRSPHAAAILADPVPLTALPGAEYGATFSPDGRRVAFFWSPADPAKRGIYIKTLDSEEVTPLVLVPAGMNRFDYSPAWSPDGKTIAFLRRTTENKTWLCLVSASEGPERELVQLMSGVPLLANHRHLSWSLDSRRILAPVREDEFRRAIHWISVFDGSTERITPPANLVDGPMLSPDGRAFVYVRKYGSLSTDDMEVVVQGLGPDGRVNGAPRSIFQGPSFASGIAWSPDGEDLVYCGANPGLVGPMDSRLYRFPARAGGPWKEIGGSGCTTVTVSGADASGQARLVYGASHYSKAGLWQANLADTTQAWEFAPSSRFAGWPAYSPDGASVAFVSTRGGPAAVWIGNWDGTQVRRLTEAPVRSPPQWSPDGGRVVFGSPGLGLAVVPVAGGAPKRIPTDEAAPRWPTWADGTDLVYYTVDHRLFRTRPDGSGRIEIGSYRQEPFVRTSPDGKSIYLALESALYRRPVDGGGDELIEHDLLIPTIAVTKTAVYFIRREDSAMWARPLSGGPAKRVGVLAGYEGAKPLELVYGFTVSPDDTRVIWTRGERQEVDLEMMVGFQ